MHTRIAGGCLYHASVALGKPINQKRMFHVKHLLCNKKKIKTIQRKKSHITVRLFARGLDKEMGMSGTDAFAPSEK